MPRRAPFPQLIFSLSFNAEHERISFSVELEYIGHVLGIASLFYTFQIGNSKSKMQSANQFRLIASKSALRIIFTVNSKCDFLMSGLSRYCSFVVGPASKKLSLRHLSRILSQDHVTCRDCENQILESYS